MATHSNILAWKIPWTEEPIGVQSMGVTKSQIQLSDWAHTHTHLVCLMKTVVERQILAQQLKLLGNRIDAPDGCECPVNEDCLTSSWSWIRNKIEKFHVSYEVLNSAICMVTHNSRIFWPQMTSAGSEWIKWRLQVQLAPVHDDVIMTPLSAQLAVCVGFTCWLSHLATVRQLQHPPEPVYSTYQAQRIPVFPANCFRLAQIRLDWVTCPSYNNHCDQRDETYFCGYWSLDSKSLLNLGTRTTSTSLWLLVSVG